MNLYRLFSLQFLFTCVRSHTTGQPRGFSSNGRPTELLPSHYDFSLFRI